MPQLLHRILPTIIIPNVMFGPNASPSTMRASLCQPIDTRRDHTLVFSCQWQVADEAGVRDRVYMVQVDVAGERNAIYFFPTVSFFM
jgi:hypothetical protein